jgi:hypothetical protein
MALGRGLLGCRTARRRAFARRRTSEEVTTSPAHKEEAQPEDQGCDQPAHKASFPPPLVSLLEQSLRRPTVGGRCR